MHLHSHLTKVDVENLNIYNKCSSSCSRAQVHVTGSKKGAVHPQLERPQISGRSGALKLKIASNFAKGGLPACAQSSGKQGRARPTRAMGQM